MKQLDSVLEELQDSKVKSKQLKEALQFIENNKDTIKKENKPRLSCNRRYWLDK